VRILVAYASDFGSTRAIAQRIGEVLGRQSFEVIVAPVDAAPHPTQFDAFIIGSAIHGNHWLPTATDYVRRETALLSDRPVWLFSSGPVGDTAVRSMKGRGATEPAEVREFEGLFAPREHRVFAGAFHRENADFSQMGLVERTLVRRFLPEGDWRDWREIEAWASSIALQLGRKTEWANSA
jgi:menaquinone-dependent protoporphyrinogen oxidase